MATIGLDMLIDPPSPDGPEPGEALYLLEPSTIGETAPHEGPSDSQASPRSNPPPPNPPFVFPARPSSSSGPTPVPRAAGRRPRSAIEPRSAVAKASVEDEKSVPRSPALPAFSFNPGASLPSPPGLENMFLSPPQSPSAPNSPLLTATRPAGHRHRRGGSEFVGGSIRDGEAITVLNTSPTKSDSGMASPMLQPTRPRRGHAHRRSAAISSHDLSSIIAPPPNPSVKENSVPASPAPTERPAVQSLHVSQKPTEVAKAVPVPVPEPIAIGLDNPSPPPTELEHTPKALPRNRVGFSDTLEYIPRPLSLVSTDTSSTVTARPGHSLSGSISSVISITNADRETGPFPASAPGQKLCESRPSTAGAVMERTQSAQEQDPALRSPRRRGSIPLLGSLPPSIPVTPATPSPTRSTKKWSFFRVDPFVTGSPTRAQPDSPRSTISHLSMAEPSSAERVTEDVPPGFAECPDTPKPLSKKRSKKKKKVKTWAGSILSRKGKHRSGKQKRRAPTPPPPRPLEAMDNMEDGELHMSLEPEPSSLPASENGDWETWTFPKPTQDEDTSYQMIDLDAALGPFNTPLPRNLEWEAAQKAGGLTKKQLHSAAGMSRFTGPGMHYYHRRAESAPELVPFEGGRFGFRRFGSSSTMADVFEEDEEEEEEDSCDSSTGASTPAAGTSIAEKPEDVVQPEEPLQPVQQTLAKPDNVASPSVEGNTGLSHQIDDASKSEKSATNPLPSMSRDEVVLIEPPQYLPDFPESPGDNANSGSATPSPRHVFRPKDLAPVEVSPLDLPATSLGPVSPWSMTQSSAFPSPRSPMSYDAQCISTAPSSVTEDNFHSLLMGEPGPEVRISVDDIPSLTSSNSTMTRDSLFAQHPQARHPPLNEQPRPASFTSTAFGRRRSSLASLSRLINSSHGERSKLSIEVPMDSEPEKKAKSSKTKRLSRMMQFWKSKDGNTA
ncbi:hypothetical protein CHGG_01637 [Chaetomium globosum CBS 148.51]|uniref:Cell wall proline rich protein n=1 Tax=Chaetomium globosum (strain ATCC 6205 / CBS 148.51 / DSM 1962 / NBRC 6347 / NRRL 1970) TaxID=306901 RepID=Q2HDR7_CHAGB|nr:uncharacterized protein CHGG_01637 [Chaetomium globosum CBS 148.51]EAQ93402.1 hypothetical protein CHGG_01637 [Chaetomium globosum CBS 148.51]